MSPPLSDKDVWLALADRHLGMALTLGTAGFHDGGFFHAYHAFECFISAGICARGLNPASVPGAKGKGISPHVAVLNCFATQYKGLPVGNEANTLRVHLLSLIGGSALGVNKVRNRCLYHESGCQPPWHQFSEGMFSMTHEKVRQFVDDYKGSL